MYTGFVKTIPRELDVAATMLITSNGKKPLTLAVYSFSSEHANDWGPIFALLTLSIIPPILFFLFMQKHFYKGFTVGAVKG